MKQRTINLFNDNNSVTLHLTALSMQLVNFLSSLLKQSKMSMVWIEGDGRCLLTNIQMRCRVVHTIMFVGDVTLIEAQQLILDC